MEMEHFASYNAKTRLFEACDHFAREALRDGVGFEEDESTLHDTSVNEITEEPRTK